MINQNTLKEIISSFAVDDSNFRFSNLNAGFINDTFLVTNHLGPQYILQCINHQVFENVSGLMNNINNALIKLSAPDYAKIAFVPTNDGSEYLFFNKTYWRLMTYIDASTTYDTTTKETIAFEAGRVIGKFHTLLNKVQISDYVDTIPQFHSIELRKIQFEESIFIGDKKRLAAAGKAISFAHDIFSELEGLNNCNLPTRICHNDTKLNNILFSKRTDQAFCLIDLDTIMKGYFYYDFGDAVRTIVNTAPEDEQDHIKITFENNLFEAFIEGLAVNGSFLTDSEKDSLSLGAIFMPFIHGLRALTDYLNGNIYYKVSYENQNLDRCLSLFDFAQKAIQKKEYMKSVIAAKFPPRS